MREVDPDEVSHDELKKAYRGLLDSRNELRKNNHAQAKMQEKLVRAMNTHIPHTILLVQALAERAGCRRATAVVEVMKYLDKLSHPQWNDLPERPPVPHKVPPAVDGDEGDAEMLLNGDITKAMLPFDHFFLSGLPKEKAQAIADLLDAIHQATLGKINAAKLAAGFKPRKVEWLCGKHPNDMEKEELLERLRAMSWGLLDLAQDMDFARNMLRLDLRDGAYRRIAADLYALCRIDYAEEPGAIDVKVMGPEAVPF